MAAIIVRVPVDPDASLAEQGMALGAAMVAAEDMQDERERQARRRGTTGKTPKRVTAE